MKPIQKILVVLDQENSSEETALRRASRVARHLGASITLLGVVPELPWYARLALHDAEKIEHAVLNEERHRLEAIAGRLTADGIAAEVRVIRGRPALEIVREALRGQHDLLIKAAKSSAEGTFLSTDRQVLRTCPCPVWLIREGSESPDASPHRMLALVDPVPHGAPAREPQDRDSINHLVLGLAIVMAEAEQAELTVAHAWDATSQGILRNCGYTDQQIQAYVDQVKAGVTLTLDRLMEPYRDRIGPEAVRLLQGQPAVVIPEFAEGQQVDLIVMGTMARSGIAGMLIGNTAEAIMGQAPCSILAVKPEGFVSPIALESPLGPQETNQPES